MAVVNFMLRLVVSFLLVFAIDECVMEVCKAVTCFCFDEVVVCFVDEDVICGKELPFIYLKLPRAFLMFCGRLDYLGCGQTQSEADGTSEIHHRQHHDDKS